MNILITGSSGFIGSELKRTLKNDHRVVGIDLFHSNNNDEFRCDISKKHELDDFISQCKGSLDIVFNCAAEFGRNNGESFTEELWNHNVVGLKNLLKLQNDHGFNMVHFSTSEIYGDSDILCSDLPIVDLHVRPLNDYALSKWVNEMQIWNSPTRHLNKIVRLFNVYGPAEKHHSYRSFVSRMVHAALHDLPMKIYQGNRSWLYINDCIDALLSFVNNKWENSFDVYNISSDEYIDNRYIKYRLEDMLNKELKLMDEYPGTFEKQTAKSKISDNRKAKEKLGLNPEIKIDEGLKILLSSA